jgi:hypothetical protein
MKKPAGTTFLVAVMVLLAWRHPYHVNVVEIRVNPADSSWQMTVRVFTHEWEETLGKINQSAVDLKNPADSVHNIKRIQNYLNEHLHVSCDSTQAMKWSWIGYECQNDETWCYYESKESFTGKIFVNCDILYEHGHQQQTIVHLYVNKQRISKRLTAPEKKMTLEQN